MLQHDTVVLCAPTAFGKTVPAAAIIVRRGVNTLILVHRTELLKQWQERLKAFLGAVKGVERYFGFGALSKNRRCSVSVPGIQGLTRELRKSARNMVPRDRIELPTRGFSIPCSTN